MVALIVLSGRAVIVIPVGLTILACVFLWAHRFLRRVGPDPLLSSGRAADRPRAADQPVTIAMFVVVGAFTASMAFSLLRLAPIEGLADDLLGNAMPTLEHLNGFRTELRRLERDVYDYGTDTTRNASRDDVSADRRRLEAELTNYRSLPTFPGEAEYAADVAGELAALDQSTEQVLSEADQSSSVAKRLTLLESF
ncbi:MAG: PGPGW domain-containing protein, partial [Polyangiaceae bacterium]